MSDSNQLNNAIKYAILRGWYPKARGIFDYVIRDDKTHELFAQFTDNKDISLLSVYSIIFDKYFARAFFGDLPRHGETKNLNNTGFTNWQYHLQAMSISEDPIKYLGIYQNA